MRYINYIALQTVYWTRILSVIITSANDVCFASFIVGILSINGIMIIGVARICDWEILWYLNCDACLMQLKLILSAYCIFIFLFQACLNFSVFRLWVQESQDPSGYVHDLDHLKTINLTEFFKGLDIGTVTHGNSLVLVLVMIWIHKYYTFIMPLFVVAEVCTIWVVSSRIIVITTHDRSNNCNNFRSVSRNMD